jgi:hypothetical protein
MPLTKENAKQLMEINFARTLGKTNPGRYVYTGYIAGADNIIPYGEEITQDFSTVFLLVTDVEKENEFRKSGGKLAQILIQENNPARIAHLNSHDPEEIENFIRKWLDSDFKFN